MVGLDRPGGLRRVRAILHAVAARARRELAGVAGVVELGIDDGLDGADPNDYVARVEPSEVGGRKVAAAIIRGLREAGWTRGRR